MDTKLIAALACAVALALGACSGDNSPATTDVNGPSSALRSTGGGKPS